jgi:high-affinity nickel-transport protein
MIEFAAGVAGQGIGLGVVVTMFGFGLRHGIDWDHIAAISDITGSQEDGRRSVVLATLYALGHALVVFVLGIAAIAAGGFVPSSLDAAMERVVGVTLLLLGAYVFYSLVRHGRDFRMRSRWMLVFSGARRAMRWIARAIRRPGGGTIEIAHDHEHPHDPDHGHLHDGTGKLETSDATSARVMVKTKTHSHPHRHVVPMPDDPFVNYGRGTAFVVGMLHGVGAETPSQVLLFLAAAGAGGSAAGVLLLGVFLVGLITTNTAVAFASTYGFLNASKNFAVYATVAVVTGAFSLALGALYVLGRGSMLPEIL